MSGDFFDTSAWDQAPAADEPIAVEHDNRQADALAMLLSDLCEVMAAETAALSEGRFAAANQAAVSKAALARLYDQHLAALHDDPQFAAALDAESKAQLAEAVERLREVAGENARVVGGLLQASRSMVDAIVTVTRDGKTVPAYGSRGQVNDRGVPKASTTIAFSGIY